MPLTPDDFAFVQKLLRGTSAMVLDRGKEYFVETRLLGMLRSENAATIEEIVARLRGGRDEALRGRVIEAMTINETSWFRDVHPFATLRESLVPRFVAARAAERRLDIWCAACSTGQEPYTVAMTLLESFPALRSWQLRILATDYSTPILARAKQGVYSQLEVNRGLPAPLLAKYFRPEGQHDYRLSEEVRRLVEFQRINLAAPWARQSPFDIVLLRNVMIYFDVDTKRSILRRVRESMKPDGVLMLGAAETLLGVDEGYARMPIERTACYTLAKR